MFYITVDDEIKLHLVQEHHHPIIFELIDNNREHLSQHIDNLDETLDDTRKRCLRSQEYFATSGSLILLIRYNGQPAGVISLHNRSGVSISGMEIGYWLAQEFVGKGIITRAARTLTDYAFAHYDVKRVVLVIATNNPRSYAIAERLGFALEGTLRQNEMVNGQWVDHRVYAMLKQDWQLPQHLPILHYPLADNLDLRLVEKRHAEAIFELSDANREHIGVFLPWVDDTHFVGDTEDFAEASLKQYGANDGFQVGIWQDNQVVGIIGYLYWNFVNNHTEIGYWLAGDVTGKGIMTQCARVLTDYAIRTLNLNRVIIRCAVDNTKSGNVARRLGFSLEGIERQGIKLRDEYTDVYVFAILAEEWQKQ